MFNILNLENVKNIPKREGTHGFDTVIHENTVWILKDEVKDPNKEISGTPLNEYIGSHIYELLGYDVQNTLLARRNNKLIVVCKDFTGDNRLLGIGIIKSDVMRVDKEFREFIESKLNKDASDLDKDIQSNVLHVEHNPILNVVEGLKERFWEQLLVDMLIDNADRHHWNWGVLLEQSKNLVLAPVYDNAGCFFSNIEESDIENLLSDEQALKDSAVNDTALYCFNKYATEYSDNEGFITAVKRVIPLIEEKMESIVEFIESLPISIEFDDVLELEVCSESRKELYIKSMKIRFDTILKPLYDNMMQERN